MTEPRRAILTIVILSCATGCVSENDLSLPAPPPGYPTAYATRDCAPTDGPAMRLYLSAEPSAELPPQAPFVDVAVWQGVQSLSGTRMEWSGPSAEGTARRCSATAACEPASQAILQFRPIGADTSVTGALTLTFGDGSVVSGGFNAAWRRGTLLCG